MADLDLTGRTAVITGASRGIGAAMAEFAVAAGMQLGLSARSKPVLSDHAAVLAESVDVTDAPAMEAFAGRVVERFGQIDLWINNAGVLDPIKPVRDVDYEAFREHIDINLTGVLIGTRIFLRHRRDVGGGGVLVNISSGAAQNPYEGWGTYCAGKAAVDRLTEVVALEEAESGLRAHAVAPGVVDTDMQALIRETSADDFPTVGNFIEMKKADRFNSGPYVAREVLGLAFDEARRTDEVIVRFPYEFEAS